MSKEITENFVGALRRLEESGEVEAMVPLFTDESEIGNTALKDTLKGIEGVREFWTNYRGTFAELESRFLNRIAADGRSALEWETTGRSVDGAEVRYKGVSVFEHDGEKITRFFAYFDPADLGKQITGERDGKGSKEDTEEGRQGRMEHAAG
jgi:limonene-1,2-epoxide hydrolase